MTIPMCTVSTTQNHHRELRAWFSVKTPATPHSQSMGSNHLSNPVLCQQPEALLNLCSGPIRCSSWLLFHVCSLSIHRDAASPLSYRSPKRLSSPFSQSTQHCDRFASKRLPISCTIRPCRILAYWGCRSAVASRSPVETFRNYPRIVSPPNSYCQPRCSWHHRKMDCPCDVENCI